MISGPRDVFIAIIVAGVIAQAAKILILTIGKHKAFGLADLFVTGSMPSTHSAIVTSLSLSIYLAEGLTTAFLISAAFAVVVIRDALGVRRTAGEEGKLINKIIKKTKLKIPKLRYSLGHTPAEVTVGVLIGVLSSVLVWFVG